MNANCGCSYLWVPIPAALIRFSLGRDPKQQESLFQTVPSKGQMFVCCEVTAFLEPLEASTPLSEVQENAVGSPHLELGGSLAGSCSAPLLQLLRCLRTHFDPNTLSISQERVIVPELWLRGTSGLWINDLRSCSRGKRDVKIIKRVT